MNSVIIVAAGSGKRMQRNINKQFIKLNEKEIISHTIDAFYKNKNIDEIIVCIKQEEEEFFKKQILEKNDFKNIKIAYGGKERQDSIYNGLKCVDKNCKIVLIHDGARPFVDNRILSFFSTISYFYIFKIIFLYYFFFEKFLFFLLYTNNNLIYIFIFIKSIYCMSYNFFFI